MDIQNRILEIVNNYDYKNDISEAINEYKKTLSSKEPGNIIYLRAKINNQFIGNNEQEISEKVAAQIIKYKINEKALIKLMSEGIIYPIGICDGWEHLSVTYCYRNTVRNTHLDFRRIVFDEFMKV